MILLLLALALPLAGGLLAFVLSRRPLAATVAGVVGTAGGGLLGLAFAVTALAGKTYAPVRVRWDVPYGEFHLAVDPLSAFFLAVIFGLSALSAVYGGPYLLTYRDRKRLGAPWFFFGLLVSSMALLVTARNGMLFLIVWEVMAIASFFLVTFEHERAEVRSAGWTYLIAAHLGTACLLVMFALLGKEAGSLDFDAFAGLSLVPGTASAVFLLALAGFGAKAGFVPFHVWLPQAHPAAPSHVSALMSGVMIKTGIYGILRVLTFLGPPPLWWALALMAIGASSGILGVLFAIAQQDLKRLLAYSSVENIGVIALGMGVGLWGQSQGQPVVALLGFAGATLHVVNHAAFKGLLFLSAGSVLHATGQRDMERLGGVLKSMPLTGVAFLVGVVAIIGLPPLNGFLSEYLIFRGSLAGAAASGSTGVVGLMVVAGALALIGGLALACFAKAFGTVFLGAPRSEAAHHAHEGGPGFWLPMFALAGVCLAIGLLPFWGVRIALPAAAQLTGMPLADAVAQVAPVSGPLGKVAIASGVLVAVAGGLALFRWMLLRRRTVTSAVTWDCGYEAPSPRMQYTASSFAQPLTVAFSNVLQQQQRLRKPKGYFPGEASFRSETPDVFEHRVYRPVLNLVELGSLRLRWLQQGRVQLYLLYIFITLVALLVWRLGA